MRIATLNVLYHPFSRWPERRPLVEAGLRELAPDVVGLQEVDRPIDQDRALAAALPGLGYRVFRAAETVRPRYPRHWDGVSLLVRQVAGELLGHDTRRLTWHRIVQRVTLRLASGRTVACLNTHLHYPSDRTGVVARANEARAILAWLDASAPADVVTLAGDLNGPPDEPYLAMLQAAGFRSAYREACGAHAATFPSGLVAPTVQPGPPVEPIDHILVRGPARVLGCRLAWDRPSPSDATLYPSDHLGLVADLEIA